MSKQERTIERLLGILQMLTDPFEEPFAICKREKPYLLMCHAGGAAQSMQDFHTDAFKHSDVMLYDASDDSVVVGKLHHGATWMLYYYGGELEGFDGSMPQRGPLKLFVSECFDLDDFAQAMADWLKLSVKDLWMLGADQESFMAHFGNRCVVNIAKSLLDVEVKYNTGVSVEFDEMPVGALDSPRVSRVIPVLVMAYRFGDAVVPGYGALSFTTRKLHDAICRGRKGNYEPAARLIRESLNGQSLARVDYPLTKVVFMAMDHMGVMSPLSALADRLCIMFGTEEAFLQSLDGDAVKHVAFNGSYSKVVDHCAGSDNLQLFDTDVFLEQLGATDVRQLQFVYGPGMTMFCENGVLFGVPKRLADNSEKEQVDARVYYVLVKDDDGKPQRVMYVTLLKYANRKQWHMTIMGCDDVLMIQPALDNVVTERID